MYNVHMQRYMCHQHYHMIYLSQGVTRVIIGDWHQRTYSIDFWKQRYMPSWGFISFISIFFSISIVFFFLEINFFFLANRNGNSNSNNNKKSTKRKSVSYLKHDKLYTYIGATTLNGENIICQFLPHERSVLKAVGIWFIQLCLHCLISSKFTAENRLDYFFPLRVWVLVRVGEAEGGREGGKGGIKRESNQNQDFFQEVAEYSTSQSPTHDQVTERKREEN